jgi:hypothetical protein
MNFNLLTFTLSLLLPVAALAQGAASGQAAEVELGRQIYEQGVLSSGELTGDRLGRNPVSGAKAACVNCHRRSGMGQVEGDIAVQPITGNFLQHVATSGWQPWTHTSARVSTGCTSRIPMPRWRLPSTRA